MKRKQWVFTLLVISLAVFLGIILYKNHKVKKANEQLLAKGKLLAEQYCSSCHIYPQPSRLTRELWHSSVLPNMGSRLGMKSHFDYFYPPVDFSDIPGKPLMSQKEWNTLVYYYLNTAPDSLESIKKRKPTYDTTFFTAEPFMNFKGGIVTALETFEGKVFVAEALDSNLHQVDLNSQIITSEKFDWPITDIDLMEKNFLFTSPGFLHPADHQMGRLILKNINNDKEETMVDSLRRALRTEIADFDNNGWQDFLICEFGHNYGQLSLLYNDENTGQNQILAATPGAINAQLLDHNKDKLTDIMVLFAQGDERIVLYQNLGNRQFKAEILYRFPSIYGSLYFELADFNQDGLTDILYTNGDNGDYTPIPKPYHGVRILMNQGNNKFEEAWFYPMYGAAMAKAYDFDRDGLLDIVATANFSESGQPAEDGLVLLHQKSPMVFEPYIYKIGDLNQWNLVEIADIDKDGDQDVLVGAMNLDAIRMQQSNNNLQQKESLSILLLRNNMNE